MTNGDYYEFKCKRALPELCSTPWDNILCRDYKVIIKRAKKRGGGETSRISGSEVMKESTDKFIYFEEKEKQFKSKMDKRYKLGVYRKMNILLTNKLKIMFNLTSN